MTRKRGVIIVVLIGLVIGTVVGLLSVWRENLPVPMTGDCIKAGCHDVASEEATIYVAVDREELNPGVPVAVTAGTSIELDFYFEDMVGKRPRFPLIGRLFPAQPHTAVGIELVVDPEWKVSLGTALGPQGWSTIWQQGGSGQKEQDMTSWQPTGDAAGRYYLDFRASSWRAFDNRPALAIDSGTESISDLDAMAGKMGADTVIWVPPQTPPGRYEIVIAGVGHDSKARKAHVAQTINVEVTTGSFATVDGPPLGDWLYTNLCSSCHEDTPEEKEDLLRKGTDRISWVINWGTKDMEPIRGLKEEQVSAIIDYIQAGQAGTGEGPELLYGIVPYVTHPVEDRVCAYCHAPNGVKPAPANHAIYSENVCLGCHQVSRTVVGVDTPRIPHPGEGRACLQCHDADGLVPVPASHEGRGESICLACHEVAVEMVGVIVPSPPHRVHADTACSSCHDFGGQRPMPQDHEGRADRTCSACHEADREIVATIPLMTHSPEGRESCLACHSPAGWVPSPEDHWERTEDTCLVCHQ